MPSSRPVLLSLFFLFSVSTLSAATFLVPEDRILLQDADAIVVADVHSAYALFDSNSDIVTTVRLAPIRILKGTLPSSEPLNVAVPGGVIGDRGKFVSGRGSGGKGSAGGLLFGTRTRPVDHPGQNGSAKNAEDGFDPMSHFPPSAYLIGGATRFRWNRFDLAGSVGFLINGTQPGFDSTGAAQRGVAAWTNDPASNVDYRIIGTTSAGFVSDGINAIVFNSATGVPAGAIGYSQVYSGGTHTFRGETFYTIIEGDVVMRSGLSTSAATFDEAVAHEIGHTLGFRHSNEGTPSSSAAVMNSIVSGRFGASLQSWDLEAVSHVYPSVAIPCVAPRNRRTTHFANDHAGAEHDDERDSDGDRAVRLPVVHGNEREHGRACFRSDGSEPDGESDCNHDLLGAGDEQLRKCEQLRSNRDSERTTHGSAAEDAGRL